MSCLKGNLHEQFLGGWAGAIPPGYPACRVTGIPTATANGAAAQGLQLLNTEQNAIKCPILVQQQRVTASGCSLTLAAFDMANLLRGE